MPNRIIKDSIRTSKTVNTMTDFQFRLWVYLITYVDDYGRGSADPELLKGFVFPRRKGVTESTIEKALLDLANSGSVLLYEVDGEPYFCFPNWSDHQRIQTKKSKFPAPDDGNSRWVTVSHGESPSESESNPNPNTNSNSYLCAEQSSPPLVSLILNTGELYPVFQADVDAWIKLYPNVDVMQQLRAMTGWLEANPKKRKTKQGIKKFINGWLSREQDKGGKHDAPNYNKIGYSKGQQQDNSELLKYVKTMRGYAKDMHGEVG